MRILIFISLSLFLFSCSSKIRLQKRKYTKGYYFGMAAKKNKPARQTLTLNTPEGKHAPVSAELRVKKESEVEETMPIKVLTSVKQHKKHAELTRILTASASHKKAPSVNFKPIKVLNPNLLKKEDARTQHRDPFDAFGCGMGILGVIGIISGIISFFVILFYLLFFLSFLGVITSLANALWLVGIIILIAVAIGLVILANSD